MLAIVDDVGFDMCMSTAGFWRMKNAVQILRGSGRKKLKEEKKKKCTLT